MTWKFKQIKPQKARGKLVESMWTDPNWVAEEKYDGDRRIAQFCGKVVRFTGCRESVDGSGFVEKTDNVPHLSGSNAVHCRDAGGAPVPASLDGTVLDGEMIFSAQDEQHLGRATRGGKAPRVLTYDMETKRTTEGMSKFVTSIMGSLPEEAVRKQIERGWLRYVVFDCLWYKGRDVRGFALSERRGLASRAVDEWANPFASMAERSPVVGKKTFYDKIIAHGGEGVVLKCLDHTYGNEKLWVKVKRESTADVVITGFKAAKEASVKKGCSAPTLTKYAKAGMIGAVVCGQWKMQDAGTEEMTEVATVSGMDDDLRADITAHPKKYLGKVLRIKHNGREPTGRFRHPRWDGLRTDKAAKDCVFDLEES